MRLENKNAIVTGAAGGFGQAIVQTFFREGANKVALVDIKENLLTDIISHLSNEGFQAFAYIADVSNEKDVEKISTQITEKFHKIDILVNNAGIAQSLPIQDVPVKDWERTIDINLKRRLSILHPLQGKQEGQSQFNMQPPKPGLLD